MAGIYDDDSNGSKFEKLNPDNYHHWKFNMRMFLIGKDLWDIVSGEEVLAETATADEKKRFKKRENLALAAVCLGVCPSLQIYVRTCVKPKDAWDKLASHFEEKTLSKKIFYRRKLYAARLNKVMDMTKHINN